MWPNFKFQPLFPSSGALMKLWNDWAAKLLQVDVLACSCLLAGGPNTHFGYVMDEIWRKMDIKKTSNKQDVESSWESMTNAVCWKSSYLKGL